MSSEEYTLEKQVEDLVKEKKFENALLLLKLPENEISVKNNSWNLITTVCSALKTNQLLQHASDVAASENILLLLCDKGNPKEILVALMEEADSFKDHECFCLFLKPIQETLKKVPGKRGRSLDWVLSTLNAHIESIPLPQDLDLQGDEKLLLDADPSVQTVNYVLTNYLNFLEPFIEEVSIDTIKKKEFIYSERVDNQREILQKYILKLLDRPFIYQDLHIDSEERPKSTVRVLCESFIKYLSKMCKNFHDFYNFDPILSVKGLPKDELKLNEECDAVSRLAIANLVYLIFAENIAVDCYPYVYSHKQIFIKNLVYIVTLLSQKENLVLFKGLHLSKTLLNKLSDFELHYNCMEMELFTSYPTTLLNIAIYCNIEAHRNLAVKLFLIYINKFDWKGRYHQIMQIISTVQHSGSQGLVIKLYKNYLHANLIESSSQNVFLGKNLQSFLLRTFVLPDKAETDILENMDKIVTALNLLRYILLRDSKSVNATGAWELMDKISDEFLVPLQTGLDLSRAHYKLKVDELKSNYSQKSSQNLIHAISPNNLIPTMPPELQLDVLNKAVITFDMIESILARIREILQDT